MHLQEHFTLPLFTCEEPTGPDDVQWISLQQILYCVKWKNMIELHSRDRAFYFKVNLNYAYHILHPMGFLMLDRGTLVNLIRFTTVIKTPDGAHFGYFDFDTEGKAVQLNSGALKTIKNMRLPVQFG